MVAITNFTMPKSCVTCKCAEVYEDFYGDTNFSCPFTGKIVTKELFYRDKECPLMEVIDDVKLP